ncbi:DUF2809 domain-containing protein [Rhizobium grahamii]|uniref:DUF2809 domain-containing protein n=1 Tax=Rhizobium grahamii TaxID=1120045 RepID=A0A5Q0CE02_9HYPH|nr:MULTISPECIES: DUF2809 domain-containing protein [Rhizobium]QFY62360.1 DUF2809 domain-containing protein [Rhizobium grahamii]QRM51458.1 DUF2809 domain-containing protein [Rhizobium sp. BG6]
MHAAASSFARPRLRYFLSVLSVIAAGLVLRRFGYEIGLPFLVVKYGGSMLWGAMVYLICRLAAPRTRLYLTALVAVAAAVAVELSRLYHTPALDAFRLTTAGALLLGRVFSVWNVVAYSTGISAACLVEAWRRR